MSKTFYYHLQATAGENVGEIEADSNDDALKQLTDTYAPPSPATGDPHKGITITIIDKRQYKKDKARIAEDRAAEASAAV